MLKHDDGQSNLPVMIARFPKRTNNQRCRRKSANGEVSYIVSRGDESNSQGGGATRIDDDDLKHYECCYCDLE